MWFLSIFKTTCLSQGGTYTKETVTYSSEFNQDIVDKLSNTFSSNMNLLFNSKDEMDLLIRDVLKARLKKLMTVTCHWKQTPVSLKECLQRVEQREDISFKTIYEPEEVLIRFYPNYVAYRWNDFAN